jgi:enamine deaminase RidA (YjgF/YER057c/UK114 family)
MTARRTVHSGAPAATCVEVSCLVAPDVLVEIEVDAIVDT